MKDQPTRKRNRLQSFDYASDGAYFITICTQKHRCLFGDIVGAHSVRPPDMHLSELGKVVDAAIQDIPKHYLGVVLEKYVVMPNHVHILLRLESNQKTPPTISRVVKHLKETVTKRFGSSIWQKGYHDHIIRNETDFKNVWRYIDENPLKWTLDPYYL